MKTQIKYALVTGAGKGLGKAIATELATKHINLLLLAREGEHLQAFCQELKLKFAIDVECLEIDFLETNAISQIENFIRHKDVFMLINNAGIGGTMLFEKTGADFIDAVIQVNVRMLAMITRMMVNKLSEHAHSYILNVASMASCCPIAYKTVYPASKAFVYSFSKSLALELKQSGIHVCVLLPGPIKTNAEVSKRIEKQGWWVKAGLQTPEKLASIAVKSLFNHTEVVIPGIVNKVNWLLLRLLPKTICIPIISRAMKNEIQLQPAC